MIINFQNPFITHQCNSCETIREIDISNFKSVYLEEFGEYSNLPIQCDCGTAETFNMNLPLNEEPINNDIQRDFVKEIQQVVRET